MKKSIFLIIFFILLINSYSVKCVFSQNWAGPDKVICKGTSVQLEAEGDPSWCYTWEPKKGLSGDLKSKNPIASPKETTIYTVTIVEPKFDKTHTGQVKVTVVEVKKIIGLDPYVCKGKEIDLNVELTDNVDLPEGCEIIWDGDMKVISSEKLNAKVIFEDCDKNEKVKAKITGQSSNVVVSTNSIGFKVTIIDNNVCDGKTARLKIEPKPTAPLSALQCFGTIELKSEPSVPSFGNIIGYTTLSFDPLNANFESKIQNAIWYSTGDNSCNKTSSYKISAESNLNGRIIKSENTPTFTVNADGTCVNGEVECCRQVFTGGLTANYTHNSTTNKWTGTASQGTPPLQRSVIIRSKTYLPTDNNSQYYDQVKREEDYHQGQYEYTNASVVYENLFLVSNILKEINNNGPYRHANQSQVSAMINQAITVAVNNEVSRSNDLYKDLGCAAEKDAKTAISATFLMVYRCAYPAPICPQ